MELHITNTTKPSDIDIFFTDLWKDKKSKKLIINASRCDISLKRVLSIRHVLDKHRENSRKYIENTTIYLKSKVLVNIVRLGLKIIGTERPVYLRSLSEV